MIVHTCLQSEYYSIGGFDVWDYSITKDTHTYPRKTHSHCSQVS